MDAVQAALSGERQLSTDAAADLLAAMASLQGADSGALLQVGAGAGAAVGRQTEQPTQTCRRGAGLHAFQHGGRRCCSPRPNRRGVVWRHTVKH